MGDATLPTWEAVLADLPDVALPDGRHLGAVVALELMRDADGLVMPKQYRAAYLARAPRMGHADECACAGLGMIQVDAGEDRWTRCRRPAVILPEPPAVVAIEPGSDPDRARHVAELSASLRARSAAALGPARQERRYRHLEHRPARPRPDENHPLWRASDPEPEADQQPTSEEET